MPAKKQQKKTPPTKPSKPAEAEKYPVMAPQEPPSFSLVTCSAPPALSQEEPNVQAAASNVEKPKESEPLIALSPPKTIVTQAEADTAADEDILVTSEVSTSVLYHTCAIIPVGYYEIAQ